MKSKQILTFRDVAKFHKEKFGDIESVMQQTKVEEEVNELLEQVNTFYDRESITEECCDVIMAIIGFLRLLNVDIDEAMKACVKKVREREYPDNFKHREEVK
ncbi:MAG: hypothetical protein LBI60_04495 [Bacteroidales bacterium]|jgi:uncharacterized protein YabN with tetrapyrrole methylase and pyrophosphatase domain|nr:hypothetical protein [Bacteroidales bacterium]